MPAMAGGDEHLHSRRAATRPATNRAAAWLRHASKEITKKHCIVEPARAPDSSHILERLGASPATSGPERGDRGPSGAEQPTWTNA